MTKRATAKRQRRQSTIVPPIAVKDFREAVSRLMKVKPPERTKRAMGWKQPAK
jgi:hypothetical protein